MDGYAYSLYEDSAIIANMEDPKPVRTRIAPSPTGFAHIGTIYQVLFDFAFTRKHRGQFIVRIEDTDRNRLVEGAEEVIYQALDWFNLEPDESPPKGGPYGPYRSSQRLDIYKRYAQQLIENGHAYYCFCTPERLTKMRQEQQQSGQASKYDKLCLRLSEEEVQRRLDSGVPKTVRLNVSQDQKIRFHDEIVGDIEIDSSQIDDQVLLKSDGYPTYHLAVVVDDHLMKITHIFRGTEWIPSTPKHVLLYQYLGWQDEMPVFVHLPLILNADSPGKLSKRQSAAAVEFYRTEGFLPEAVLNYLSNIVWNHPGGKEIYSLEEFISLFQIKDLQSKGAKFDLKKLKWMNGEYIRKMPDGELGERLQHFLAELDAEAAKNWDRGKISALAPLVRERIKKLSDFIPLAAWMFEEIEYDRQFFDQTKVNDKPGVLQKILEKMEGLEKPWVKERFEQTFQDLAKELILSNTQLFQLIRVAVSGQLVTPPLFESLRIMGEEKSLERIRKAIVFLDV